MTVQLHTSGIIPQWFLDFHSQFTWEIPAGFTSLAEHVFYSYIQGVEENSPDKKIADFCITHFNEIQFAFNVINAGTVALLAQEFFGLPFISIVLCPIIITFLNILIIDHSRPVEVKETDRVSVSDIVTTQQTWAKVLHLSKILFNILFIAYGKSSTFTYFCLAGTAYSFMKNHHLKWAEFTCSFSSPYYSNCTYTFLKLSPPLNLRDKICTICSKNSPDLDLAFCPSHAFHSDCITNHLMTILPNIQEKETVLDPIGPFFPFFRHNILITQDANRIPLSNYPTCPVCKQIPNHSTLESNTIEIEKPPVESNIVLRRFIFPFYQVLKIGLAILQTYPELAPTLFKIQQVLLIPDLMNFLSTCFFLQEEMISTFDVDKDHSLVFLALTMGACFIASYFFLQRINMVTNPSTDLQSLANSLPVGGGKLHLSWSSLKIHTFMCCLISTHLIASVALILLSEKQHLSPVNTVTQILNLAVSLSTLLNFRWISFTYLLNKPLQYALENGGSIGSSLYPSDLKSLSYEGVMMIPPSCSYQHSHLESVVHSIQEFCQNLFKQSIWKDVYWMVTYQNGVEIGRTLYYDVLFKNVSILQCDCTLPIAVASQAITAIDNLFGFAKVKILSSLNLSSPFNQIWDWI